MRPVRLGNDPKQGVWISSPGDNDLGSDRNTGRWCSKTPGGRPGLDPGTWECFQNVQGRFSTSRFAGQKELNVHQRQLISSHVSIRG